MSEAREIDDRLPPSPSASEARRLARGLLRRPMGRTGLSYEDMLRGGLPLARNFAGAFLPAAVPKAPAHLSWGLTEACQLRCLHCDLNKPGQELTRSQRSEVAQRIGRSRVWSVGLVGGEVTLVKGLVDLVAVLKQHGKVVSLASNGERLDALAEGLCDVGLDYLTLSFDSHRAEEHDAFRRRPGLFDTQIAVLERLQSLRASRSGRPKLQVRGTINRRNVDELCDFVDFFRDRADNVMLQVVQDNGMHSVRDDTVMFRPEDRPRLEAAIEALMARFPFMRSPYYALMPRFVFEPKKLYEELGFRCLVVPTMSLSVMPDGELRLCFGHGELALGNILERDLEAVWRDQCTQAIRDKMRSRDFDCMCWEAMNHTNLRWVDVAQRLDRARGGLRSLFGG